MEIAHVLSALWRNRAGAVLIAIQTAIALTVLVNVAYVIEQRIEAFRRPSGIDVNNIFWVESRGFSADYEHASVVREDLAYLNSIPGVLAAAAISPLPQTYTGYALYFSAAAGAGAASQSAFAYLVTERGLDALGLKIISGRAAAADAVSPAAENVPQALGRWAPEVVITKALAQKVFPAGGALGKTLYTGLINKSAKIVGIVDSMQVAPVTGSFAEDVQRVVFVPAVPPGPGALYLIRTVSGRRSEVMAEVERKLGDMQPSRFISRMEALEKTRAHTLGPMRSSIVILIVVASLVIIVTAIGIFGLGAFTVANRTKQIGTRRAIGARRMHILRYFLLENWLITSAGCIIGCVGALALGVQLSDMLELSRVPLYYLAGGVVFVWIVGLCAVLVPARRAAAIPPAVATRSV